MAILKVLWYNIICVLKKYWREILMSYNYTRHRLLDGIYYNSVIDSKFKSNTLTIKFIVPLEAKDFLLNCFAIATVSETNSKYPTIAKMSKRLQELYGSGIGYSFKSFADLQILTLQANWIDDLYTFDEEDITKSMVDILVDCIFNPYLVNGDLHAETFNIIKNELTDSIENQINNKRHYAVTQANKTIFAGEPAQYCIYDDRGLVREITSKQVLNRLNTLINTANIEIFYVGREDKPYVQEQFTKAFSTLDNRTVQPFPKSAKSVAKSTVAELSESMDVNQTKLIMAFKTDCSNRHANIVMNAILGLTPTSKLFANVREKLSLCYYCQSSVDNTKGVLYIDSGIEPKNYEQSKQAILQQVEDLKDGNFSEHDVDEAITYISNSLKSLGDVHADYVSWYLTDIVHGLNRTLDSELEKFHKVTKPQIVQ